MTGAGSGTRSKLTAQANPNPRHSKDLQPREALVTNASSYHRYILRMLAYLLAHARIASVSSTLFLGVHLQCAVPSTTWISAPISSAMASSWSATSLTEDCWRRIGRSMMGKLGGMMLWGLRFRFQVQKRRARCLECVRVTE